MLNLAFAIAAGLVAWSILPLLGVLSWFESAGLGVLVLVAVYVLAARRSGKQLEAVMMEVQKDLMGQRFDAALAKLDAAMAIGRWQFLVTSQLHSDMGYLLFVQKKFDEARPHLDKAFSRHFLAMAAKGVLLYKAGEFNKAFEQLEKTVLANKKQALVWGLYAWCYEQQGEDTKCLHILSRGTAENPADEKLKAQLELVQNGKKMRMDRWAEQWWQFHLEKPSAQRVMAQPGQFGGGRFIPRAKMGKIGRMR